MGNAWPPARIMEFKYGKRMDGYQHSMTKITKKEFMD